MNLDPSLMAAAGAVLGYLLKLAFDRGVLKRMDDLIAEVRQLSANQVRHAESLALGSQAFMHLREQVAEQSRRMARFEERLDEMLEEMFGTRK